MIRCRVVKTMEDPLNREGRAILGLLPDEGDHTPYRIGKTLVYECHDDQERSAQVYIQWSQKVADQKQCILDKIFVNPWSKERMGFGTQALFNEMQEMYLAGCREVSGESMLGAVGYWDQIGAEKTGEGVDLPQYVFRFKD